ncbi:LytR/AlgR family response regulator transcription factor [Mucilaginibacter flavidus]|uniref:LytR/AlgR family response regulator transcription factor n=1 Tax=Mucilaginibacter flavidus TaxID=2949309 RepID=UPI0020924F6D|nr:LytTR family DNA-binding domain-containing protein [Mucilaginibacter flavidus]MCO5949045.1 LytTR family DNA-binding domain-containing protein [Mucilaginibacter flavidus]
MKLNCLIVDDEPIARNGLAADVKEFDFLHVAGLAEDAFRALQLLNSDDRVDILFLDIDMPGLSGLDFLKLVRVKPVVIITTAYPQYAIDGFELGVVDYLLKPISTDRLAIAIDKARKWLSLNNDPAPQSRTNEFLYVKCNGSFEKILFRDILYVEAANNYVFIHTAEKRFITYNTLKGLEAQLPANGFVKVHKSYLVSRNHIGQVKGNEVIVNGAHIPLSRNFKDAFQKEVISGHSLRKD